MVEVEFKAGSIEKFGTAAFSGGGTGPFNITHGMTPQPDYAIVIPSSVDAAFNSTNVALSFYVTIDSTNIVVNYNANTDSGTDNVDLMWMAGREYSVRNQIHSVVSDTEEYGSS